MKIWFLPEKVSNESVRKNNGIDVIALII